LKDKYIVTTVGLKDSKIGNVEFVAVKPKSRTFFYKIKRGLFLKFNKFEKAYWCRYGNNDLLKLLLDRRFVLY